ncbi:MAG: 3'-5' exonuclease, partial [Oscillospiraceae bacterium]
CQEFVFALAKLRQRAAVISVDELLQEIYDQTDFISLCYAMGNGEQKDANLRLLLNYAKKYEEIGGGLSGFLRYIDRIISNKQDFSCANSITQSANTVKIMTIHSSKGLEFPICIIADCAKQFNKMDLKRQYQFNSKLFLGMKISDNEKLLNYSNLPFEAIKLQTEKETISEEMRVLYVALTRAKEKLIMVMTLPKAEKKIASLANKLTSKTKINSYDVFKCNSYADWIIMTLLRHEGMKEIANECGVQDIPKINSEFPLTTVFVHQGDVEQNIEPQKNVLTSKPNPEIVARLQSVFNFKYKQEELTKIPVKLTVTQIAKQSQNQQYNLDDCPKFLMNKEISPAKRGTILHSFMQYANFQNAKKDVKSEINRLVQQDFLTQIEADTLEID